MDTETKKKLIQDRTKINQLRESIRKTKGEYIGDEDIAFLPGSNQQDSIHPVAQYSRVDLPAAEPRALKDVEERKSFVKPAPVAQLPGYNFPPAAFYKKSIRDNEKNGDGERKKGRKEPADDEDEHDDNEDDEPAPAEETKTHKKSRIQPKKTVRFEAEPTPTPLYAAPPQLPPPPPAFPQYYPYPYPPPPPPWLNSQAAPSPIINEHLKDIKNQMQEALKRSEVLESEISQYKEKIRESKKSEEKKLTPQELPLPTTKQSRSRTSYITPE